MQLLESSRARRRSRGVALVSVVAHATLLGLAVVATASAAIEDDPATTDRAIFVVPPPVPPAAPETPTARPSTPASGPAAPTAPVTPLPDVPSPVIGDLPPVDARLADPSRGVLDALRAAAERSEPAGGSALGSPSGVFSDATVDRAVIAIPGAAPRYPEVLRGAGVEGRVVARFVVDTAGRIEAGSLQIVSAAHPAFAEAVRRTLPALRFRPAEAGGRRVRQLVDMPFDFMLAR